MFGFAGISSWNNVGAKCRPVDPPSKTAWPIFRVRPRLFGTADPGTEILAGSSFRTQDEVARKSLALAVDEVYKWS